MTIAVDLGRKATKQTNKQTNSSKYLNFNLFLSPKSPFICSQFRMGLHCLPKYLFDGIQMSSADNPGKQFGPRSRLTECQP